MDRANQKCLRLVAVMVAIGWLPSVAMADEPLVSPAYHTPRQAYCSECAPMAARYNAKVNALYATANTVTTVSKSLESDAKALQAAQDKILKLKTQPVTPQLTEEITKEMANYSTYQAKVTKEAATLQGALKRMDVLPMERSDLAEAVSLCEVEQCSTHYAYPVTVDQGINDPHALTEINLPMPMTMSHKHTTCKDCVKEAIAYNDLVDTRFQAQKEIRTSTIAINLDEQLLQHDDKKAKQIYLAQHAKKLQPLPRYSDDVRQYKADQQWLSSARNRVDAIDAQLPKAADNLDVCETDNCRPNALPPKVDPNAKPFVSIPMEYQLGLFLGNTLMFRDATASSTFGDYSQSTRHDVGEFGGAFNILFGSPEKMRLLVYMNMLAMLGSSQTLLAQEINPVSISNSTLHMNYDWLARIGLGFDVKSKRYQKLRYQAGLAMAIVHQNAASSVVEYDTGTHNRIDRKDIRPSIMGGVTYDLCDACFYQSPVALFGQLFLDNYSSVRVSGSTPAGNAYLMTADQHWELHEQLGLLVKF